MPPSPDRVAALLAAAGYDGTFELTSLSGGTNNRVFRVDSAGRRVLLKAYYADGADTRDRLGVEFRFLHFAWGHGIRCVPQPLGTDTDARLGLFEFIDGERYVPGRVTAADVDAALGFVLALNSHRDDAFRASLPPASDSCFTGDDYLHSVDRRLGRLAELPATDDLDGEVSRFVRQELAPAWADARQAFAAQARAIGWATGEAVPRTAWCPSPSDFGFHNALATAGGARFIDFEYAGWDDAAKLVCDFFGQFEVPVPAEHFDRFAAAFADQFEDAPFIRARMGVVMPACRFKWCCIILNDFHPGARERRSFAHADDGSDARRERQLQKARAALQALITTTPSL